MKRRLWMICGSLCLITIVSVIAGNCGKKVPVLSENEEILKVQEKAGQDKIQEKLEAMLEELPDSGKIDVTDMKAAQTVHNQIAEIYALAEENNITLTTEQETKVESIIEIYDPPEEESTQQIPETGGALYSGIYVLQSNLSLEERDLYIPADAEVIIDLNGYGLTGTGKSSVITVEDGGSLTLKDSSFYPIFRGGSVSGGIGTQINQEEMQFQAGGGILVKGTFQMQGGNIQNCTANSGGGVYISEGGSFFMSGGEITNCSVSGEQNVYGGGVQVSGGGSFQMTAGAVRNCTVIRSTTAEKPSFGGGGISVYNGKFTMEGGVVSECTSDYHGGGIYISDQSMDAVLTGGSVENCSAAVYGGGIYILNNEKVSMTGGAIANCSASGGGAVCIQGDHGKFDFQGGDLIGVQDDQQTEGFYNAKYGGGIYVLGGSLQVSGGTIRNFRVSDSGGGLYLGKNADLAISNGILTGCQAEGQGGGIYFNGMQAKITGGSISECEAAANGGGIYVLSGTLTLGGDAIIQSCTAEGDRISSENTQEMVLWDGGGGIFAASDTVIYFEGGRITECSSSAFGGGIFCYGIFFCSGGEIDQCSAFGGGGILIAGESNFTMSKGSVKKCHAFGGNGGGISLSSGTMIIQGNPVILENTKEKEGNPVSDNLYLPIDRRITLEGELTEGASIGIFISPASFVTGKVPFTTEGYMGDMDISGYFISDVENIVIEPDPSKQYLNAIMKQ